jgi:hypothetical protein
VRKSVKRFLASSESGFGDKGLDALGRRRVAWIGIGAAALWIAGDKPIDAKGLAIEEHAFGQAERGVELLVEGGVEFIEMDAKRLHPVPDVLAEIHLGRFQGFAAPIAEQQALAVDLELVALGMAAKIVVIFEDEDLRRLAKGLAIEPGCCEPADAAADHYQIVLLLAR